MTFEEDIREAVSCLRKGGILLYPTDTVWGIGCDATNPDAVKRIYDLKRREESKSMLVLVDGEGMLDRTVKDVPEVAWQLIEAAVRPLTIIYDHPTGVAQNLLAPDGSLGIRITEERYSNELIRRFRRPIVSTSANISGEKAPAVFHEIGEEIINGVDYVAEYRRDEMCGAVPSNIIKLSDGGLVKVIR
ncbi:MAG: threonylcarbamoyl-AMP synthase [Muribaculaceae bacterium]